MVTRIVFGSNGVMERIWDYGATGPAFARSYGAASHGLAAP